MVLLWFDCRGKQDKSLKRAVYLINTNPTFDGATTVVAPMLKNLEYYQRFITMLKVNMESIGK